MFKKRNVFKKKWFWILSVVILTALAGGAYYYYSSALAATSAETSQEATMQTSTARTGDLVVSATGSGSVATAAQISVGFDETGTLTELNVGLGDKVKAGDVLARLQTQNTPEEIAADISDAELAVIQAQQSLDELYANAETSRTDGDEQYRHLCPGSARCAVHPRELQHAALPARVGDGGGGGRNERTARRCLAAFDPYKYYPPRMALATTCWWKLN